MGQSVRARGAGSAYWATLRLHDEVSLAALPHLEAVLDGVIALGIPSLRVDLTDATRVSKEALAAIRRRRPTVTDLEIIRRKTS